MSVGWFGRQQLRADAKARLFCFPYAGVGGSAYRLWPKSLPVSLDVCPVHLPGREQRYRETSLTSMAELVDSLITAMLPHLNQPFAFFGHSMGAVFASEVTRALADSNRPLPQYLLVSGRRPPRMHGTESSIHALPDAQFISEINRRYQGIPAEILQQPDLMALFLPALRADLTALETHRPLPRPPLSCPIVVFGGADDPLTPREHLEAWRSETSAACEVHVYPGDHFYLNAQRPRLLSQVAATLAPMLATPTLWSARA
jgi:medium-chain acyl-[acyl-carrier-protein] hydrolase